MRSLARTIGSAVAVAGLLVLAAPNAWATPESDFAAATDIGSADTVSVSGDVLTTDGSVWYLWTAPFSGLVSWNTCDTDFDNTVAWYANPGPTLPDFTDIIFYGDDTDGCGPEPFGGSIRTLSVSGGVTYAIQVGGFGSSTGSFVLTFVASKDNTPPPVFEAIAKVGECDTANGWGESWQDWVNGGRGGAVCERTLAYWSSWGGWVVVRFDVAEGKYVPVWGAKAFASGAGSGTESPGVKAGS